MKKTDFGMFFAREALNFKITKNHSLRHQPTYKCDLHAKCEVSTLNGLAYSVRTNMKKRILACFFSAKRPILKLHI